MCHLCKMAGTTGLSLHFVVLYRVTSSPFASRVPMCRAHRRLFHRFDIHQFLLNSHVLIVGHSSCGTVVSSLWISIYTKLANYMFIYLRVFVIKSTYKGITANLVCACCSISVVTYN